jgi:hypothetical protein
MVTLTSIVSSSGRGLKGCQHLTLLYELLETQKNTADGLIYCLACHSQQRRDTHHFFPIDGSNCNNSFSDGTEFQNSDTN